MVKAVWNGKVIAESEDTVVVEGNHYFPRKSVDDRYLKDSDTHTVCPWKGTADYWTLKADGQQSVDAAWSYPQTKERAAHIKDRVAFYGDVVTIEE
ncbi:uncharacterized protein (DUF427 family) [Arthrobacter sp. CAN_A214]|uniref:DUF427 domain-containing protein n=1 Tax=Arthrobacter sp. CAN_A214 TaxID=2787720 RepID=UPI0018CB2905